MTEEDFTERAPVTHPGRKPVFVCDDCGAKFFVEGFNPDGACEHVRALIAAGQRPREEV